MEEKPKRDDKADPRNICPICGGDDFRWGTPTSNGGVWFQEDGTFLIGNEGLRARACNSCGNVQFFLKDVTD